MLGWCPPALCLERSRIGWSSGVALPGRLQSPASPSDLPPALRVAGHTCFPLLLGPWCSEGVGALRQAKTAQGPPGQIADRGTVPSPLHPSPNIFVPWLSSLTLPSLLCHSSSSLSSPQPLCLFLCPLCPFHCPAPLHFLWPAMGDFAMWCDLAPVLPSSLQAWSYLLE